MKLGLVTDALDPTHGWGRYAGELARGLIAAGVDVRLTSPRRHARMDDLRDHPDHRDIPSFQHGRRHYARVLARTLVPLWRALRGVDVIHCVVEPYAPCVALVAGRRPYFVSLVGTYARPSGRPAVEAFLMRRAMRRARRLPAISRYTEMRVREDTGFLHTAVVPLGVRAAEFAPPDPPPPREPGLILSVGEVKPRKGLDVALEAFTRIRREIPEARYAIVGSFDPASAHVQALRRRIDELSLTGSVTMTGPVGHVELVAWYHRASLVVMPYQEAGGDFEGFGLVLLEAGACGVPVVSSLGSGAEEPVVQGENGLLVPPGDVDALVAAVRGVLTRPDLWRRLAEGGRRRATEMTWERSTERLLDVYADALGTRLERSARV